MELGTVAMAETVAIACVLSTGLVHGSALLWDFMGVRFHNGVRCYVAIRSAVAEKGCAYELP